IVAESPFCGEEPRSYTPSWWNSQEQISRSRSNIDESKTHLLGRIGVSLCGDSYRGAEDYENENYDPCSTLHGGNAFCRQCGGTPLRNACHSASGQPYLIGNRPNRTDLRCDCGQRCRR